jgi:penicillin amidase
MVANVLPWVQPNGGLWMDVSWANHPTQATEEIPGLDDDIYILRDSWGVPHIFANSTQDLYLGCGYVHAQDRFFQMDLYRRLAQGRLAEILGPDSLELDLFYRQLGLERAANESLPLLSNEVLEILESYSKGINEYLSNMGSRIPMEIRSLGYIPEPWTEIDTLSIERFIAWLVSGTNTFQELEMLGILHAFGEEVVYGELFPEVHYNDQPIIPRQSFTHDPENTIPHQLIDAAKVLATDLHQLNDLSPIPVGRFGGSNSWVVNASRSSTNAPILCSDPHFTLTLPTFWYEVHFNGPSVNLYGITFPGFPFAFQGHNEDIAWGFTGMNSDVYDFYYYKWHPSQSKQYWWEGAWRTIAEENITLFGLVNGQLIPVPVTLNFTVHGPTFDRVQGRFALKWTGHNGSQTPEAYYRINTASNYADFLDALQLITCPNLNLLYADTANNIAYHATGAHPIRSPSDGLSPLNGSTGTHEWLGFIPFIELPQALNPATGFLVAANNIPVNTSYPYYLGRTFTPSHRAHRISQLLNSSTSHSIADMQQYQLDSYSLQAEALKDIIANVVLTNTGTDTLAHQAASLLQSWNAHMTTNSIGATIWASFLPSFFNATFYDEYHQAGLPEGPYPAITVLENFTITGSSSWFDDVYRGGTQTRDNIILESFQNTVDFLTLQLGPDPNTWEYGRIHILWIQHTLFSNFDYLNGPRYPINGSEYAINYAPGYLTTAGATYRLIIDLSDFDNSLGVLPGGQRANAFSNHYLDQLGLWVTGDYHPLLFPSIPEELTMYESILILIPPPP